MLYSAGKTTITSFEAVPCGWCPEAVYNTQIVIWSGLV